MSTTDRHLPESIHPLREGERYGSKMLRRFGWFYSVLGLGRLLGRIRLEEHSAERIRTAAEVGPVVYVLLRSSTIEHLALNTVLNRRRLPLSVWSNGVTSFWWQPVGEAWADVGRRVQARLRRGPRPEPVGSGWLARAVTAGATLTVFLWGRRSLGDLLARRSPPDPLEALLLAQESSERSIQLLPAVVVWDKSPESAGGAVRGFLQGNREEPGLLTRVRNLLTRSGDAFVQVGDPVDLGQFIVRVEASRRREALRTLLRRYLKRESHVVRGPRLLPRRVVKRIVLENPPMRRLAREEAEATHSTAEAVHRQMEKDFDAIAANFKFWVIRLLDVVLHPLWTRVFSGVDVGEDDLERIRTAMRDGTAVLVPSHKSHFDYILISWVLYEHDLIVPHIVAGMNLSIWPLSFFLRRAGALFVKRSFAGERVFPAVFQRYVRELVRQGYPVEFFIEGGRTRTGKLLPPRHGVLGMILDAAEIRRPGQEVTLLPISVAYEQVAEERAYARELEGGSKRPESVSELVKARAVLRRRFGRAYLRVGEPLRGSTIVDPVDGRRAWSHRARRERLEDLARAGERLVHRIGRASVVLPTSLVAAALLAHHRRGIRHDELVARTERFLAFCERMETPIAASLARPGEALTRALARLQGRGLVQSLAHEGGRVWAVAVEHRITLDFYKNQILHNFVSAGYAACAARSLGRDRFHPRALLTAFRDQTWLLRREFVLDPDRAATALLADGLEALVAHGALSSTGGEYEVVEPGLAGEIYGLFRNFLEAYTLVLLGTGRLLSRGLGARELARALQSEGPSIAPAGRYTRPEALSLVGLRNAISSFVEDGVLVEDDRGQLSVDAERHRAALALLTPLVD